MKKLIQYAFVLAIIVFSGFSVYESLTPACNKTLKYSVGRFDTQFGVTREDFLSYAAEAEKVWEKPLKRDAFVYDPEAKFKINLIYDERQISTTQKQRVESGLSIIESDFRRLDRELSSFKNQYEQKTSAYKTDLTNFEQKKSNYDKEVSYWNERGGAPEGQFEKLEAERISLNTQADRLNAEAANINSMTDKLNSLLSARNSKASEYNTAAREYNRKYNESMEFNQAEYNAKGINIYQFGNDEDLTLALAHELGHAIGMDHVENPDSVMYYVTSSDSVVSLVPSEADLAELDRVCR